MSVTDQQITMRAHLADRYGGPEVIHLGEVPRPQLQPDRVVVQVQATSINPLDWHEMRGEPWLARLQRGIRRPSSGLFGTDVAGVVVEVGSEVTAWSVGDRVVGAGTGAFAEFAVAKAANLAVLPDGVAATDAAALPVAGVTALQALRAAGVGAGSKVLIVGASGGVGTFAVQLAAARGCSVTAVCSSANVELVRSLGAHDVVDYTTDALARLEGPFDAIVDMVGSLSFQRCKRLLVPGGRYVVVGGPDGGRLIGPLSHLLRAKLAFVLGGRRAVALMAKLDGGDVAELVAMLADGRLRCVIDRVLRFEQLPEAIAHVETRHARGKVVVAG